MNETTTGREQFLGPLRGQEFYEWPEWRALCKRLGIELDGRLITRVVIDADVTGFLSVGIYEYQKEERDADA